MSFGPVLHFCQVPSKYSKRYLSYRADTKSFSNKTKCDSSKSKKARVVNLLCNTSSRPDLHFYQVSSKYSKGYSSYRVDKKFYADVDGIRPKNNMSPPHPTTTHTFYVVGGHNKKPEAHTPHLLTGLNSFKKLPSQLLWQQKKNIT